MAREWPLIRRQEIGGFSSPAEAPGISRANLHAQDLERKGRWILPFTLIPRRLPPGAGNWGFQGTSRLRESHCMGGLGQAQGPWGQAPSVGNEQYQLGGRI